MDHVVIARIGKPHGIRGESTVQLHTDDPAGRLAVGAVLQTEPADAGPLTIASRRVHNGITLLGFAESPDRNSAELLRGVLLLAGADTDDSDDGFTADDLRGFTCRTGGGTHLGVVDDLLVRPAQDLLVVATSAGDQILVPFVASIVTDIDTDAGVITLEPPGGLFE